MPGFQLPNAVLCRYSEIAVKGSNRHLFERAFFNSIRRVLAAFENLTFSHERGRHVLHYRNHRSFTDTELDDIRAALPRVFGLVSFSPGYLVEPAWDAIHETVTASFAHYCALTRRRLGQQKLRYRARARRQYKPFPLSSRDIEIRFAEELLPQNPDLILDLDNADLTLGVEVRRSWGFVFYEHCDGPGGLPVGSSARVLALLSGGIDSPVASYLCMKRGCTVDFLTFHSHPYTPDESVDKVRRLVLTLNRYQKAGELLACNLSGAQKIIRDRCSERYRTVLYRRLMMRIADVVAAQLKAEALVTGEVVGQVASQTVRNLDVVNDAADHLILRPLIAMDKEEITALARRIGTYTISEVACPDSCTVFAPRSPATRVHQPAIVAEEARLDIPAMIRHCLAHTVRISRSSGEQHRFTIAPELLPPEPGRDR